MNMRKLHEKFKDKRMNGEWFRLNANDIRWIKSMATVAAEKL